MGADHFTKVFDIANSGFKDWQFCAFGLIFVAIGTAIFFAPAVIKRLGIPYFEFPSKSLTFFRYAYLGFALFWTVNTFLTTYGTYGRHRDMANKDTCNIVEGPVAEFVPMPYGGHAEESFSVLGVRFSYSDYGVSDAFNNTSSHGGPVSKDSYVRICYDPADNAILRLEIRNFHGILKNYSRGDDLFSDSGASDHNAPPIDLRKSSGHESNWFWLADLWVLLYFLDILATLGMFIPYLRTFWRSKTIVLADARVPAWLERGRKIKLRNSLIYWDTGKPAIWLRPRGFNVFRVPCAVAKLNVDEPAKEITSAEVRLSSGVPVVFALFFPSAYLMFSTSMPGGSLGAAIFVVLAALIFLVSALSYRRRVISRVEMLVKDALDEFAKRTGS